eukprot:TCONS_00019267-protein
MSTGTTVAAPDAPTNKKIYVGNLGTNVTRDDLVNLFGLAATPYLKTSCTIEIATCEKTGKSKNFAFVNVPEHVHSELMKLNGIEFYGRQLVIEEAKTKDDEKNDENKENRNKQRPYNNNRRGRGGYNRNNGRGGNRYDQRKKYTVPAIEADQVFSLVDGGCNLTNPRFNQFIDYVIARALKGGIQKMVVTGLKMNGCKSAVVMSKTRPNILYAAVGIHPHFVKDDWTDKSLNQIEELVKDPCVVAIGECGLDFNKDYSPRELQETAFKEQINLAVRYKKTLLVHDRDAHQSILDILEPFTDALPPVIIHCFTGTKDQIKAYIDRGYYIGVTGYLCKEKYGGSLREAIKDGTLPLDKIIVQTNSPYMTPSVPQAEIDPISQTLLNSCCADNEPCTLSVIVRYIARLISQEPSQVADVTTATAMKLFRFTKSEN